MYYFNLALTLFTAIIGIEPVFYVDKYMLIVPFMYFYRWKVKISYNPAPLLSDFQEINTYADIHQ